ncbi:MAG: NUDIX hydrolase [Propionibacteriaceae bacterium]|nr:NUDIX hydrolase [Propionibacteriaceae bacterium]
MAPHVDRGSGILSFEGVPDPSALLAAARAAFEAGLARVEARVPLSEETLAIRRAFYRAGFHREGIRRGEDVGVFSLLVTDRGDDQFTFTSVMNSVTPRKRLIAHAVLTDADGRVVLCQTSYKRDLELPGGIVEPGESPRVGCEREITEEMGIEVTLDRLLALDWLPPHLGWEDATEVVFGAPELTAEQVAAIQPDGQEILALHWLTPDEAAERLAPFAVGRLRSALAALADGRTRYLEGGTELAF